LLLYQIVILLLKNPNTIRTFSAAFSQKALCSRFPDKCEAAALRPNAVIMSAAGPQLADVAFGMVISLVVWTLPTVGNWGQKKESYRSFTPILAKTLHPHIDHHKASVSSPRTTISSVGKSVDKALPKAIANPCRARTGTISP
jgi:hypothetical protein